MARRSLRGASQGDRERHTRPRRTVTPLFMQTHATECGAACLGIVLAHFGRWVPLTELRVSCEVGRDGSTAAGLKRAAGRYGLKGSGWSVPVGRLKQMPLPMILFWEFNHFVVLEGFDRKRFYLNDPAAGHRELSPQEFDAGFTGVALTFRPGSAFEPGGAPMSLLRRLPLWLSDAWGEAVWAVVCGLMLAVLALAAPFGAGRFIDRGMGEGEPWGLRVAGVLAGAGLAAYGVAWLKQRFLRRLAIRSSIVLGSRSVSQLLRLPVDYFSHRLVGDLTGRILSVDKVARGLSERFVGLLVDAAMSVVFLVVMMAYDPLLALAVLALALLNALLLRPVARVRSDEASALRREARLADGDRHDHAEPGRRPANDGGRRPDVRPLERPSGPRVAGAPAILRTEHPHRRRTGPVRDPGGCRSAGARRDEGQSRRVDTGRAVGVLPRRDDVSGTDWALRRVRPRASDSPDRHATLGRHHGNAGGSGRGAPGGGTAVDRHLQRAPAVGGACGVAWCDLRVQPEPALR